MTGARQLLRRRQTGGTGSHHRDALASASGSGSISTAGGILVTGKRTGELILVDEDNGKTLWQFKTSSAIHSMPITYTHKGKQYITVINGLGGNSGINNPAIREHVLPGASVWTFALMD